MEFGLVWTPTGCLFTTLPSVQNPGSSKQGEVWRVVQKFKLWKFFQSPRYEGNCCKKKQSLLLSILLLSRAGKWKNKEFLILTKGVNRQPVRGQTRPNSTQVLGLKQPNIQCCTCSSVNSCVFGSMARRLPRSSSSSRGKVTVVLPSRASASAAFTGENWIVRSWEPYSHLCQDGRHDCCHDALKPNWIVRINMSNLWPRNDLSGLLKVDLC